MSRGSRPPSKWDKPKSEPPAPINRNESGDEEQGGEEMPPPAYTKTMMAKFQTYEDVQTSPKVASVKRSATVPSRSRPSQEGDLFTNGHQDVVRTSETHTEELPEQGFTKNLLAQWRTKEQEAGTIPSPTQSRSVSKSPGRWSQRETPQARRVQTPESDLSSPEDRHSYAEGSVMRESDRHDEDELPPPSFTRNMLAKFQSMQDEAQREASNLKPTTKKVVIPRYVSPQCIHLCLCI